MIIEYETHDDPVPLDLMKGGSLFNDMPLALETAFLLSETTFYHSVAGEDLAVVSIGSTVAQLELKHTTSYFSSSRGFAIRDAPCQTRTFIPSVWAVISLRHCMIATVGLGGGYDQ